MALNLGLQEETLAELSLGYTTSTYAKNSLIFPQGSPGDVLFLVTSGIVKTCYPVRGRETAVTVDFAGPGELVGYACTLDTRNRRTQAFGAHALTDCTLALMSHERIIRVLEKFEPRTLVHLIGRLNLMWSKISQTWVRRVGLDLRTRLFEALTDLSTRFGVEDDRGVMLIPELSHGDLADMVGCSRQGVTKFLDEMITDGVLERSGKHYIVVHSDKVVNNHPKVTHIYHLKIPHRV
jgi:CRP/FNR family transcriptional regulator, cyclic AMP receptor protein